MAQLLKRIVVAQKPNILIEDLGPSGVFLRNQGDARDLLSQFVDGKNRYKFTLQDVCSSRSLDNLIKRGHIKLYDERGTELNSTSGGSAERATNLATLKDVDESDGGEASNFLNLTDTPSSYLGNAGYLVRVNSNLNGLEFVYGESIYASSTINLQEVTNNGNVTTNSITVANLTINGYITTVDSIQFKIGNGIPTFSEGQIYWDEDDKTISMNTDVNGVTIQLGQENVVRVVNKTGSTILNGTIVYGSGAQENRLTVAPAIATNQEQSHKVIGVATSDIGNNNKGYVTVQGLVRDLDTSEFSEGDYLFLSEISVGKFTNVEPTPPNCRVEIGIVITSHQTQGIICVRPGTYQDLENLCNVNLNSLSDGQFLSWDNSNSYWINTTLTSSLISDFNESIDDRVSDLIVAGNNITITYNDVSNLLTIDSVSVSDLIYSSDWDGEIGISPSKNSVYDIINTFYDYITDVIEATKFVFPVTSTGTPSIYPSGDSNTGIGSKTSDQMALILGGVERYSFSIGSFSCATGDSTPTHSTINISRSTASNLGSIYIFNEFYLSPNLSSLDGIGTRTVYKIKDSGGTKRDISYQDTIMTSVDPTGGYSQMNFYTTQAVGGIWSPSLQFTISPQNLTSTVQISSTLSTGISPFLLNSTTLNVNLNSDLLDGYHLSSILDTLIQEGNAIDLTYTDATNTLEISVDETLIDHLNLQSIGTYNHSQIDAHIDSVANPHSTNDANILISDISTNNVSTIAHGFAPKLSGINTQFLNGSGSWITPVSGTANAYISQFFSNTDTVNVVHAFGGFPLVQVIVNGSVFVPFSIIHNSVNDFTINFTENNTGFVVATIGSPQLNNYSVVGVDYTLTNDDYIVEVNTSSVNITLPSATTNVSKSFVIKNSSNANIFIKTTGSEYIDFENILTLISYEAISIYSNGTNYRIF